VTPEPPFSAAIGLAAALGLTFFGVRASWIAVVGGDPEPPISRAHGLAAALGFLSAWACRVVSQEMSLD
jgi:hypothetical protein